VQYHCWPGLPLWQKLMVAIPLQCVEINLDDRSCVYYVMYGDPIEHEHDHCLYGADHNGILQAYFDKWKAAKAALANPERATPKPEKPEKTEPQKALFGQDWH
jgi:hypothetical protein